MAYATTSMSLTHRWHSHTHTSPRARLISFCLSACERACAMAPRGRLLEYVHVCVCVYVCEWVSECVCLCAVGRGAKSSSPFGLIVAPPSFPSPWISSFSLSFSCFNFTLLSLSFSTFLRIASSLSLLSSLSLSLSLSLVVNSTLHCHRCVSCIEHHSDACAVKDFSQASLDTHQNKWDTYNQWHTYLIKTEALALYVLQTVYSLQQVIWLCSWTRTLDANLCHFP